jgi:hypothetical protein
MRIGSLTANPPLSEIGYLLHFNMWVEPFEDRVIIDASLLMWTVKITIILKCSKHPISLRGELAVSEAILIHCYSDFNSSHKQTNFDDHTAFKRFNSHIKM